jgi:hypothetical protein
MYFRFFILYKSAILSYTVYRTLVLFYQNLKIKKDLPLRNWFSHAPLSRFLYFLNNKLKRNFLDGIKNKKSKTLPHFEVTF